MGEWWVCLWGGLDEEYTAFGGLARLTGDFRWAKGRGSVMHTDQVIRCRDE